MAIISTSYILALTVSLTIAATLFVPAAAQSSSSSCSSVLISMSPCLNYISGNSSKPSSSCCSSLSSVVSSQPDCLCQVISGDAASSLGLSINKTQALALPAACNVKTPSISRCSGSSSPTGSPSTTTPSSSGSTGSNSTPSTPVDSSDGNALTAAWTSTLALFFVLFFTGHSAI